MRILIAEDERDLNKIIRNKLTDEGYSVDYCYNGEEACDFLSMGEYDVAILDIMMPKKDGYQVLEYIQANGLYVPVLFLTARDSIEDRVKGLDSGAADYLVKPFSFQELLARIRVMMRHQKGNSGSLLTCGDLSLDTASHEVKRAGKRIELSAKEYQLLAYMMNNQNVVLSREKIENHIWNFDYEGGTNVVDVYIRYLRKKIDADYEVKLIQTIRGSGYMLKGSER